MKIAVITYNHPHQKTQDLICKLKLSGYNDIDLVVLPWVERKSLNPFYKHRPDNPVELTIEQLAERFDLSFHLCEYESLDLHFSLNSYDKILIGGAGILPKEIIKYKIINAHPGYIPNIRCLDALKWSILQGQPIAVTTHFIGEQPDTGRLIERCIVPLSFTDTFHSIARRQYDMEIDMLVNALTVIPDGRVLEEKIGFPTNQRMNHSDELRMIARLNRMLSVL
jgi:hypothetical protein